MSALTHTTRIAVRIVIDDEAGQFARLVTALTALIWLMLAVTRPVKAVVIFAGDVIEAASFTGKVLAIGFNALAFGLRVRI